MSSIPATSFVPTNIAAFFSIARQSLESMEALQRSQRIPKPGGEAGSVLVYDPDHKSFKNALVTIVFSGIYLEALLHLLIVKNHGLSVFKKYDSKKSDADKLTLLGCTDTAIIDGCAKFKAVRKEIVHEKAHLDSGVVSAAQEEATKAFALIKSVNDFFGIQNG